MDFLYPLPFEHFFLKSDAIMRRIRYSRAGTHRARFVLLATVLALTGGRIGDCAARPQDSSRGREVYEYSCANCHDTGIDGAPGLGDRGAWTTRVPEWAVVLESHAVNGFIRMPPKGGYRHLRPEDVTAAVSFMREKLGSAAEPTLSQAAVQGRQAYMLGCSNCHDYGINGAPKFGDPQDWANRAPDWTAVLVRHAVNGFLTMEPKGGYRYISDEDVSLAVAYMVEKARDN